MILIIVKIEEVSEFSTIYSSILFLYTKKKKKFE